MLWLQEADKWSLGGVFLLMAERNSILVLALSSKPGIFCDESCGCGVRTSLWCHKNWGLLFQLCEEKLKTEVLGLVFRFYETVWIFRCIYIYIYTHRHTNWSPSISLSSPQNNINPSWSIEEKPKPMALSELCSSLWKPTIVLLLNTFFCHLCNTICWPACTHMNDLTLLSVSTCIADECQLRKSGFYHGLVLESDK